MTHANAAREERRTAPRSRIVFPVELALPGPVSDTGTVESPRAMAEVCDLSLSGIRCVTTRPIGVMTQLGLLLVLPDADTAIDCRGAVVRSRKMSSDDEGPRYETAIFFTSMAEADRMELQEFLQTVRDRGDVIGAGPETEPDAQRSTGA